jgi:hypothetical protein
MRATAFLLILLSVGMLCAQVTVPPNASTDLVYICPMDHDIRSNFPGKCSRCGMKMVEGIPEPVEYHLDLSVTPKPPKPQEPAHLRFDIHDPWKDNPVTKFTVVHEKLFHAFIVSEDLQYFVHDHPTWDGSSFNYDVAFPKPGMYRILGDFYPEASSPQLIAKTVYVAGAATPHGPMVRDYSPKKAENLSVEISTFPLEPVAGANTQMHFKLSPADGIEKYLGAWGHMLAASDDLIDMVHTHPFVSEGGPDVRFDLTFARARTYRVWVQFQRNGVVNTAHFDIPVKE